MSDEWFSIRSVWYELQWFCHTLTASFDGLDSQNYYLTKDLRLGKEDQRTFLALGIGTIIRISSSKSKYYATMSLT